MRQRPRSVLVLGRSFEAEGLSLDCRPKDGQPTMLHRSHSRLGVEGATVRGVRTAITTRNQPGGKAAVGSAHVAVLSGAPARRVVLMENHHAIADQRGRWANPVLRRSEPG